MNKGYNNFTIKNLLETISYQNWSNKNEIIQELIDRYVGEWVTHQSDGNPRNLMFTFQEKTKEVNINVPERDISPLKTVKKRTRLKIIGAVLCTAAVLFGVFMFVFWGVVPITSDRVHYTVEAHKQEREYEYTDSDSPDDAVWQTQTETVEELNFEFESKMP